MKKLISVTLLIFTGVIIYLVIKVGWPVSYDVTTLKTRTTTRYWDLPGGSRIGYTFLGASTSKKYPYPLIYLHGGPGAGITSREINTYEQLSQKGYDIYLYDQVGCGHSERLEFIEEYTADRHLRDLEDIVKMIGSEKVILVGQSWGSILAVSFLAKNPCMVDKLIITAPAPIQPANKELESIAAPDSLRLLMPTYTIKMGRRKVATLRSKAIYLLARRYNIKLASDVEADGFATHLTTELNKSMVCDTTNAVVAEGTEGLYVHYITSRSLTKMVDRRDRLKALNTPVLVMKAQCDNQLWGYTTEYFSIFRNHQFTLIKNAGHNIFLEQPAAYIDAIDNFIR